MAEVSQELDLEYEINDKGERVLVRSLESNLQVYLRFRNKTSRPVNVWWRDYRGAPKFYVRLEPNSFYDIVTYVTHPWHFSDAATNERYVINSKLVYRPPPNLGGVRMRTNWNINVNVRTLRATVLLTLATLLKDPASVSTLGLPQSLSEELEVLINKVHRELTPPRNP